MNRNAKRTQNFNSYLGVMKVRRCEVKVEVEEEKSRIKQRTRVRFEVEDIRIESKKRQQPKWKEEPM